MSSADSNSAVPLPSQKRPLEDPSSDSGPSDQPDAKRPALDGGVSQDDMATQATGAGSSTSPANGQTAQGGIPSATNGASLPNADGGSATASDLPSADEVLHTQPIQSTANLTANGGINSSAAPPSQDESSWLHVRAIISSTEAATIIGKGGENVNMIRKTAGAKLTISEYAPRAVERILTVSGLVDAVAKAFGLIIRTLNQESLEESSNAQSKTYPLRLLVPHVLIGSIIGQKGVRIREIQEASSARLNASDSCLPLSTERSLVVLGVADAVHIATYYIGTTLVHQLTEKYGGPAASAYASRNGMAAGIAPGGMQVVPYYPQSASGHWGPPSSYNQRQTSSGRSLSSTTAYAGQQQSYNPTPQPPAAMPYGPGPAAAFNPAGPAAPHMAGPYPPQGMLPPAQQQPPQAQQGGVPPMTGFAGQPLTQQIYIPNDMVGAIIGKGGQKINEIRQMSGSVIKINEPTDNSNERLVTVTGTQDCNRMALYLLYQRLESEKHRA